MRAPNPTRTPALTRILLGLALWTVVAAALASAQSATDAGTASTPAVTAPSVSVPGLDGTTNTTVSSTVAGIIQIVVGVILCFFGIRIFRVVLFLSGASFFGVIAFAVLTSLEPEGGYKIGSLSREAFYAIIIIIAAIIGGALAVCLWVVGLVLMGAAGGVLLGLFIQSLKPGGLISSQTGMWIFVGVLGLIGAIAAYFLQNHIIIIGTAIQGSYSLFNGIDAFAKTGYSALVQGFLNSQVQNSSLTLDGKIIGMLVGFAVTALVGIIVQYRLFDGKKHGVNQMRKRGPQSYGYAPIHTGEPKVVVVR